jgi:hypothetical protein
MDFQKLILYTALAFTLMMLWNAWQEDYVRPKSRSCSSTAIER